MVLIVLEMRLEIFVNLVFVFEFEINVGEEGRFCFGSRDNRGRFLLMEFFMLFLFEELIMYDVLVGDFKFSI